MKLTEIKLHNFLSHADTKLELNGARLTAIVGPNGAGKSSMLDAIAYTLFDAARGRTDDLVRLGSSDMAATITFDFAGATYRVTRGRTTRAGGKSYLELHILQADSTWSPLTGDDIRSTQQAIAELLRLDADTFTSSAFLRQGEINQFISATPAERKRVLGSTLGLDVYERAEDRTRELARDLDARLTAGRDQVARLELMVAERSPLTIALAQVNVEVETLTDQLAAVRAEREQSQAALVDLTGQLGEADAAARDVSRLTALMTEQSERWKAAERRKRDAIERRDRAVATLAQEARIHEAAERAYELEAALTEAKVAAQAFAEQEADYERAVQIMRDAERDHASATRRLGELVAQSRDTIVCPQCGATIPAGGEALAERVLHAGEAQAEAKADLEALGAPGPRPTHPEADPWAISEDLTQARALAAAAGSLVEAERVRDEALTAIAAETREGEAIEAAGKATRKELDAARTAAGAGEALRQQRRQLEAAIEQLNRSERQAESAASERRTEGGRLQARLEALERAQAERDELTAGLQADATQLQLLRRLVVAFGVNGIPARIIESVLPELGRHANELLAQLRPGMALEIRAQRAKKSGAGVVEALDLVVRDDVGERPLAMFSGGERMSVSLAVAVGLSRLVARRAGTAIRTLVIDEPDGLDADARRSFGQALRLLAHQGELERVVLVSHHEDLAEVGDAVYRVTKNGRGSVVEQIS